MDESTTPETHDNLSILPESIRALAIPESGWDRIRQLYQPDDYGNYPEERGFIVKSALTGALVGAVYGGVPAARFSREHYIKQSHTEVYRHRVEAVRSAQNAAIRGFIRYGFRWGWRVAAFSTIFNVVSTGLSVYRDTVSVSHYAAAGAVTGGLFRLNLGLRGLIGGSVIGALLGLPVGALMFGLQIFAGETLRDRRRRERRQLYEEKLREWNAQLQRTGVILHGMEEADRKSGVSEAEKIEELLQLPRNPDP